MTDPVSERLTAAADAVRAADLVREQALVERAAAVHAAREAGWTIRPIAEAMGLPVASVQADLRRGGSS